MVPRALPLICMLPKHVALNTPAAVLPATSVTDQEKFVQVSCNDPEPPGSDCVDPHSPPSTTADAADGDAVDVSRVNL